MKNPVMSNNAFVKAGQNKMAAKMGDRPGCPAEMKRMNAYMSNDDANTQKTVNKLTADLSDAFPVNKS